MFGWLWTTLVVAAGVIAVTGLGYYFASDEE